MTQTTQTIQTEIKGTRTTPDIAGDARLQADVIAELAWTSSVDAAHIGVAVDGGAVTLSGTVKSYPQRLLAERAALRVRGVTAVVEEIKVHNSWAARTDLDIAVEAAEALDRAVDVPTGSVQVVVNNHHVTLSGEVLWHHQRQAAERSVRYVKGVFGVSNHVYLRPVTSPDQLEASITAALVRNAQLAGARIAVTTSGRAVTLEGRVQSSAERRQAETAAWSAPGVTDVNNHLRLS